MNRATDTIRVLHVDDDPDLRDVTGSFLEREDDRISVQTAASASEGLDLLSDHDVDCIVSDYDMPGQNGIDFLDTVREQYPDLPFILYTGKGSEAVASDAISAGVTDYLQKGTGTDQYTVLANRIGNSVERYQAEQAQKRNRVLVEEATDAILIVDADATIRYATPSAKSVLGRTPEQLIGTSGFDPIHPDDKARVMEEFAALVERPEGRQTVEFRYQRPDGSWMWAETRGRNLLDTAVVNGIVIYTRDITEHKERARELERQTEELEEMTVRLKEQYQTLFEQAPLMMILTSDEGGRPIIEDCNTQFAETLGYSKETLVGTDLAKYYTADAKKRLLEGGGYDRSLEDVFTSERRELVTADGEIIEAMLRAVPRQDTSGEVVGTLAMYVDITEREQVKRANESLEEFTRIVSHDLRNPLNVANGRLELVREECESDHLETIERAHDRMYALIEDLLTLASEGERVDSVEPVELGDLVEGCWATVAASDATLVTDIDQAVQADKSRLKQLLENLMGNAVEHGGDDVTVTIGALDDGFYVEDDGSGIPEDERDEIFEAGYSTAKEGTGFGLSIVKQVADAHGWTIRVTESSEGGARFEIRELQPPVG